jgi:uncharacterized membrane protein
MFEPGDLNAVSYWSHLFVGSTGLLGALLALLATKGSGWHRTGGWIFIVGASVAAVTALHFQFTRFAAPAIVASLDAFIGISAALLALRRRTPRVYRSELALAVLNGLLLLGFLLLATMAIRRGVATPLLAAQFAVVPVVFLLGDLVYLRHRGRGVQLARHASRMIWTFVIALRAPLFEVRDDFGLPPWTLNLPLILPPLLLWIFRRRIGLGSRPRKRAAAAAH